MLGKYVSIKFYEIHDGDGVRTTLFLKGCPLHCQWCHNPECISFKNEIVYYEEKCKNCGLCTLVCKKHAHYLENGVHKFDRAKCLGCGECKDICTSKALTFCGKDVTPEDIVAEITKDQFVNLGLNGGITISGGEPLGQPEFTIAVAKLLKEKGVNVAIDTTLYTTKEILDRLSLYVDEFLVDAKAGTSETHKKFTGVDNKIIYENMKYLETLGKPMEIRVPYVPKCNSDEMELIAEKLEKLTNITGLKVLPYHSYAKDKYYALGGSYSLEEIETPTEEEIARAKEIFKKHNLQILEE